jgi:hypothetical protein
LDRPPGPPTRRIVTRDTRFPYLLGEAIRHERAGRRLVITGSGAWTRRLFERLADEPSISFGYFKAADGLWVGLVGEDWMTVGGAWFSP